MDATTRKKLSEHSE